MGYTQYTTPISTTPVFQPLPLEAILQGNKAMYERGEKNFTKLQGLVDNAYNLPSLQGKDTEVKNQIIQSYMNNVSQLAKGDLRDAKTSAQIEGYINRIARDPQITGIVNRATFAGQEEKKRAEAEAKNETYICPVCEEAQEYVQQGVFLADKKFNQSGWVNPNIGKLAIEADKLTPDEEKKVYNPRTGQYDVIKFKNPDKLKQNLELVLSQTNADKTFRHNFNKKYNSVDWETEGQVKLNNDINNLKLQVAYAEMEGLDATPYKQSLQQYEELLQNPSLIGEPLKEEMYKVERDNFYNTALRGAAYANKGMPEISDLQKLNIQFNNAKELKRMDLEEQSVNKKQQLEDKRDIKLEELWAQDKIKDIAYAPESAILEMQSIPSSKLGDIGSFTDLKTGKILPHKVKQYKDKASSIIPETLRKEMFKQEVKLAELTETEKKKLNQKGEIEETDVTTKETSKTVKLSPSSYIKVGNQIVLFYEGIENPVVRTIPSSKTQQKSPSTGDVNEDFFEQP